MDTAQSANLDKIAINAPFTELFSILVRYKIVLGSRVVPVYSSDELHAIRRHLDNGTLTLLQGMQDLGQMISALDREKLPRILENIGEFISVISNLIEALTNLNHDAVFALEVNYNTTNL